MFGQVGVAGSGFGSAPFEVESEAAVPWRRERAAGARYVDGCVLARGNVPGLVHSTVAMPSAATVISNVVPPSPAVTVLRRAATNLAGRDCAPTDI